jgi:hypothetical protein
VEHDIQVNVRNTETRDVGKETTSMKQKQQVTRRKERVTLSLSADMVERLRTVVYWSPKITLTGVVESAILSALQKLEKGKRFKKRKGKLPVGRPRKDQRSR